MNVYSVGIGVFVMGRAWAWAWACAYVLRPADGVNLHGMQCDAEGFLIYGSGATVWGFILGRIHIRSFVFIYRGPWQITLLWGSPRFVLVLM